VYRRSLLPGCFDTRDTLYAREFDASTMAAVAFVLAKQFD
jgi:hypothetical protein